MTLRAHQKTDHHYPGFEQIGRVHVGYFGLTQFGDARQQFDQGIHVHLDDVHGVEPAQVARFLRWSDDQLGDGGVTALDGAVEVDDTLEWGVELGDVVFHGACS